MPAAASISCISSASVDVAADRHLHEPGHVPEDTTGRPPSAPPLPQLRHAPLGERDLDHVEVAAGRRSPGRPPAPRSATSEPKYAAREVGQGQQLDARRERDGAPPRPRSSAASRGRGRARRRRNVASWTSRSAPVGGRDDVLARRRVAGEHDRPPRPRRPDQLLGRRRRPVRERHRLSRAGARPRSGPNGTPSASAASSSNRPGRSSSTSA